MNAVMNPVFTFFQRLVAWVNDHANPLLVRILRQELRRKFFWVLVLLPLGLGCVSVLAFASMPQGGGMDGSDFFQWGIYVWIVLAWGVAPAATFAHLVAERQESTRDLMDLTGLNPLKVVFGAMGAGLTMTLLFGTMLLPFLAIAMLLGGVDLRAFFLAALGVPMGCVLTCALAAFLGARIATLPWKTVMFSGIGGAFYIGAFIAGGLAFKVDEIVRDVFRSHEGWYILAIFTNIWFDLILIFIAFAAALLSPPTMDRSTWPRATWCWIPINFLLWIVVISWLTRGFSPEPFALLGTVMVVMTLILGAFAITEQETLSVRQQRSLSPWWSPRFPWGWLRPGAGRGRILTVAMMVLGLSLVLGSYGFSFLNDSYGDIWCRSNTFVALVIVFYGLALLLGADLLRRNPRNSKPRDPVLRGTEKILLLDRSTRDFKPSFRRLMLVSGLGFYGVGGLALGIAHLMRDSDKFWFIDVLSPISLLIYSRDMHYFTEVTAAMIMLIFFIIVLLGILFIRGLRGLSRERGL